MGYTCLSTLRPPATPPGVAVLELARPAAANALSATAFVELREAMRELGADPDVRCVVLRGQGKHFCAGADLSALASAAPRGDDPCPGRERERLYAQIIAWQAAMTSLEDCRVPVVAAVHGACVGAGVDLITAADVRLASADATFCVKEVDLAIVADLVGRWSGWMGGGGWGEGWQWRLDAAPATLSPSHPHPTTPSALLSQGTLQRLPRIVGDGVARELALTARTISAAEAERVGLVSRVLPSPTALHADALATAAALAAKSPLALAGTKRVLLDGRGVGVGAGLRAVAAHNAAFLPSADLAEALAAAAGRRAPVFRARL